jgi:DNA-binding HxlR family transcriptional regulator
MSNFLKAAEAGNITANERKESALVKWGTAMSEGFVFVPRALMRHQADLELDSVAVMVLLNLIASWWEADDLPYPRPTTIAKRIGVHVRTVQRHLSELEERGLIARARGPANGRKSDTTVTRYDLRGLVKALEKTAVPNAAQIKNLEGNVVLPPQVM